jgi:hypothetical protein
MYACQYYNDVGTKYCIMLKVIFMLLARLASAWHKRVLDGNSANRTGPFD